MKIFPRKEKVIRGPGNFYFGDYDGISIGISETRINKDNLAKSKDTLHYHKQGNEFYLTTEGMAVIEIEGKEIELNPNRLIMVESGEKHYIKKVIKIPFCVIAICTTKDPNDKVIV